ncbi:MAG: methionine synthase, partial [Actinobacteria bacterium]|nr:methionine synthase [Actinomycetota bacterium]
MSEQQFAWVPLAATGIGSLPGTSSTEAARVVAGELADFIHVFELPARGPGSDIIGRTAALLSVVSVDLGLDTTPQGWRVAPGPGR